MLDTAQILLHCFALQTRKEVSMRPATTPGNIGVSERVPRPASPEYALEPVNQIAGAVHVCKVDADATLPPALASLALSRPGRASVWKAYE